MNKKLIIWGVALLTAINVASLSTIAYYNWDDDKRHRSERRREKRSSWEERLGLTTVQSEQIKTMRGALMDDIRPLREAMKVKRDRFYELVMAPSMDRAAIDQVQGEMDSLQADIKRMVIDHMLAHKDVLTPEQQTQFFEMMKKRYGNGNYRRN